MVVCSDCKGVFGEVDERGGGDEGGGDGGCCCCWGLREKREGWRKE